MASIFGHGLTAYVVSKTLDGKNLRILVLLAILSAIIPDADVIAFKFGIPYEHVFGHRGFTHSMLFGVLWALILTFLFGKGNKKIFFVVLFLSTLSHGILDAMTTGGRGVGFFIPFDNARYFFPWRPIKVSPIGVEDFFSEWGISVILSELKYIGIPSLIIWAVSILARKRNVFPRK